MNDEIIDLEPNTVINKKWIVQNKCGRGTYSVIYLVVDRDGTGQYVMKVESKSSKLIQVLKLESGILREMQDSGCVAEWIDFNSTNEFHYLIMEFLGENLSQYKESFPNHIIDIKSGAKVIKQVINAVRKLHEKGYVHRDIKPSNFVFGRNELSDHLYMIDFGLCKQWRDQDKIIPAREKAPFRGTTLYASLASHYNKDLAPKDDLYSVVFMFIDLIHGLPWRNESKKEKEKAFHMKEHFMEHYKEEIGGMDQFPYPQQFINIFDYLGTLHYEDVPDYDLILNEISVMEQTDIPKPNFELGSYEHAQYFKRRAENALKNHLSTTDLYEIIQEAEKYEEFYLVDRDGSIQILYEKLMKEIIHKAISPLE